jgi:hypothetical protein
MDREKLTDAFEPLVQNRKLIQQFRPQTFFFDLILGNQFVPRRRLSAIDDGQTPASDKDEHKNTDPRVQKKRCPAPLLKPGERGLLL